MFTEDCGLPVVCLRYFNVFGPRQNPKSQYAAAVPIFIDKCLRGEDIVIYGDGEQTRDFIFVKDIVAANAAAAEGNATGVFNIACGKSMSIKELADTLKKITGSSSRILHAEERAGRCETLARRHHARTHHSWLHARVHARRWVQSHDRLAAREPVVVPQPEYFSYHHCPAGAGTPALADLFLTNFSTSDTTSTSSDAPTTPITWVASSDAVSKTRCNAGI